MEDRHSGEGSEDLQNHHHNGNGDVGLAGGQQQQQQQQAQQQAQAQAQQQQQPQHPQQDRFQRNQGTILFVGNLPFQTPWQHVKDHFRQAGNVRYTDLIADRTGRPKGSALVTMMNPEGADTAIRMFNETDFEGRRLIVRKFDDGPRPPLVQQDMMPSYSNAGAQRRGLYGGNAVVNNNNNNNNNPNNNNNNNNNSSGGMMGGAYYRGMAAGNASSGGGGGVGGGGMGMGIGYGVGGVSSPYQVGGDGMGIGGAGIGGMSADLDGDNLPKPRSQQVSETGRKLFVSNLPFDCTSSALRETFQQVGNVERAEVILGRSGKSRGMGIVVMKSEEEARVAIAEFDGIEMAGRAMNVRLDNRS